ncbi:MAG: HAMP domain-containing protein [Magnetococcales bacterium]|nr:HAMP domain-containing protein [Magnetococcales bacterium]
MTIEKRMTLPIVLMALLFLGAMGWLLLEFQGLEQRMAERNTRVVQATTLTFQLSELESRRKPLLLGYRARRNPERLDEMTHLSEAFQNIAGQLVSQLDTDLGRHLMILFVDGWQGQSAIAQRIVEAIQAGDETTTDLLFIQWDAKEELLSALFADIMGHVSRLISKPLEELRHSRALLQTQMLSLILLAALMTGGSLLYQKRRVVAPLRILTRAADEISLGGKVWSIPARGQDEIAQLSVAFNRMTERLLEANASLEEKVRERTANLSTAMAETQRYAEELRAANRELESFSFVAGHDLQEPLRILLNYTGLLRTDLGHDIHPDVKEDLRFIEEAASRMRRLIQDLLAYSQARGVPLNWQRVDLDQGLTEVMRRLHSVVQATSARVTWNSPPKVLGDPAMLTNVLQHLVENAIKFHRPGTSPEVTITVAEQEDIWEIRIMDNGIGIDERHREIVFQPFKRLNRRADFAGSGIGLAIVQEIVTRHGGHIRVDDAPTTGSVFIVTLSKEGSGSRLA